MNVRLYRILTAAFFVGCVTSREPAPAGTEAAEVDCPSAPAEEPRPDPPKDADGWEGEPAPMPEAVRPEPPGFGPVDLYSSHDEACVAVVAAEVEPKAWRRPILDWCEKRSYHASRNQTVVSRVDGSQIHDRDRPTAWKFYEHAVLDGVLDPEGCLWHRVNRKIKHYKRCRRLKVDWPFNSPKMTEELGNEWLRHPHDMERFGARGPVDLNANAYRTLPGCWDPQQLERFDVAMTITVRMSLKICECWGCSTWRDIRAHWGRRSTRCPS